MTKEDFAQLQKDIYENSKAHGWWDEPRTIEDQICLLHSELSECYEEVRKGKGLNEIYYVNGKPEGIPIELSDYLIRAMDWAEHEKYDIELFDSVGLATSCPPEKSETISEFILEAHRETNKIGKFWGIDVGLDGACYSIIAFCIDNKIDIISAIRLKHEYNKTRPYRHGGKVF